MLDSSLQLPRSPLAPRALGIMLAVVLLAATRVMPIHVAAFIGVILMLVSGCVKLDGLGRALSPAVVLLVASSIALGQSLVSTGAAEWIASGVTLAVANFSPAMQIAAFMAFSAYADQLRVEQRGGRGRHTDRRRDRRTARRASRAVRARHSVRFANLSFATPMAYQTNLLVMNAAGYRFADFLRVGLPLVLLMLVTLSILLARRYGL
jgi:di/tricarboxylate transporter